METDMGEEFEKGTEGGTPPPVENNSQLFAQLFDAPKEASQGLSTEKLFTPEMKFSNEKFDGGNRTQFSTEDGRTFTKRDDNTWSMSYKQNGQEVKRDVT